MRAAKPFTPRSEILMQDSTSAHLTTVIRLSPFAAFRPSASHLKPLKLSLMQITSQPQYKSFLQNVLNSTLLVFVVVYVVASVCLYKCATHKQHEIPLRICQPLTDVPQIPSRDVSFAI